MEEKIIIFVCIFILFEIIWGIYRVKNSKKVFLKICYSFLLIMTFTFAILYFIDRYNIPTSYGLSRNMDSQHWLDFIGDCIIGMISTSIGALVAVGVSLYQIKKNNEDNDKRDKENFRIQNMPLLKYECVKNIKATINAIELKTKIHDDEGAIKELKLRIKNIGLNTVRRYCIYIQGDILDKQYGFSFSNSDTIEKNQEIVIPFLLRLKLDQGYCFNITVFYQDLMFNTYKQDIILKYKVFAINNGIEYIDSNKMEIKDEIQVNEFPTEGIETVL